MEPARPPCPSCGSEGLILPARIVYAVGQAGTFEYDDIVVAGDPAWIREAAVAWMHATNPGERYTLAGKLTPYQRSEPFKPVNNAIWLLAVFCAMNIVGMILAIYAIITPAISPILAAYASFVFLCGPLLGLYTGGVYGICRARRAEWEQKLVKVREQNLILKRILGNHLYVCLNSADGPHVFLSGRDGMDALGATAPEYHYVLSDRFLSPARQQAESEDL